MNFLISLLFLVALGEFIDFGSALMGGAALDNYWQPMLLLARGVIVTTAVVVLFLSQRKIQGARYASTAIDSTNHGYWVLDVAGNFIDVNSGYCKMLGYSRAQVLKMKIADFEAVATQEQIRNQIARIMAKGYERFETRHRHLDGHWVDLEITVSAIDHFYLVAILKDVSSRKVAEEEIRNLAFYDPLTGLPNRRMLMDRLAITVKDAVRRSEIGALIFIDIDDFKSLNDTRGHDAGDKLLVEVSKRLLGCIRANDTLARLGGDEFVIMLEKVGDTEVDAGTQLQKIGAKILTTLNEAISFPEFEHFCTASLGATLFGSQSEPIAELLKRADLAMYKSKSSGRNQLSFFEPTMQAAINEKIALQTELLQAIKHKEFELYYQPKFDLTGGVEGAEALIRWRHPVRGVLPPGRFINLAEESQMIVDIGDQVLELACKQLRVWGARAGFDDFDLSVNISARQFQRPDFVEKALACITLTQAPANRLVMEITESVMISDVNLVISKMEQLKARGIRFSLDDFGTGYSSLAYLRQLPIDELKIDASFVRDLLIDQNDRTIAQLIISMGQGLNLTVIAEGVENELQREMLVEMGCTKFQGYLFGKPMPIADFEGLLPIAMNQSHEP